MSLHQLPFLYQISWINWINGYLHSSCNLSTNCKYFRQMSNHIIAVMKEDAYMYFYLGMCCAPSFSFYHLLWREPTASHTIITCEIQGYANTLNNLFSLLTTVIIWTQFGSWENSKCSPQNSISPFVFAHVLANSVSSRYNSQKYFLEELFPVPTIPFA